MDSAPWTRGTWSKTPGIAKLIMLIESVVIVFLATWMYEEYVSNPYLQSYLGNVWQAEGAAIGGGILALVLLGAGGAVFWKSKSSTVKLDTGSGKIPKLSIDQRGKTSTSTVTPISTAPKAPAASSPVAAINVVPAMASPLSPIVAAMKAEIFGTPVTETAPVPKVEKKPETDALKAFETASSATVSNTLASAAPIAPHVITGAEKPKEQKVSPK